MLIPYSLMDKGRELYTVRHFHPSENIPFDWWIVTAPQTRDSYKYPRAWMFFSENSALRFAEWRNSCLLQKETQS